MQRPNNSSPSRKAISHLALNYTRKVSCAGRLDPLTFIDAGLKDKRHTCLVPSPLLSLLTTAWWSPMARRHYLLQFNAWKHHVSDFLDQGVLAPFSYSSLLFFELGAWALKGLKLDWWELLSGVTPALMVESMTWSVLPSRRSTCGRYSKSVGLTISCREWMMKSTSLVLWTDMPSQSF